MYQLHNVGWNGENDPPMLNLGNESLQNVLYSGINNNLVEIMRREDILLSR